MPGVAHRIKLLPQRFAACVHFSVGDVPSTRIVARCGIVEGDSICRAPLATQCTANEGRKHGEPPSRLPIRFEPSQLLSQRPTLGTRLASTKTGTDTSTGKTNGETANERLGPPPNGHARQVKSRLPGPNISDLYARMLARRTSAQNMSEPEFEKSPEELPKETATPDPTPEATEAFTEVEATTLEKSKEPREDLAKSDIAELLQKLPPDISDPLMEHEDLDNLVEIVMDLGRPPEALFAGRIEALREGKIITEDLTYVISRVGRFGLDNRAGIEGTLHRISCTRNREGAIYGLTVRVGKPIIGPADLLTDIISDRKSVLFLGAPGVGKTSVIRDVTRVLSNELGRRVMIVDTSNEIAGDGCVPHPIIGRARRLHVPDLDSQYTVMIEAVQNHRPEVIVVDEIGRWEEAQACLSISQRGVQIIATAHGQTLQNLMNNSPISGLVGGIQTIIVGDLAARQRAADIGDGKPAKKTIQERRKPSSFQYVVEMRSRNEWIIHHTETSVDSFLRGQSAEVQVRRRDPKSGEISKSTMMQSPEAPAPFSMNNELGLGSPSGTELSHRNKLPAWEWFRSGLEIAIRRRLEAENLPSSPGKVNKISNFVISDVQKQLSEILGMPPLHIKPDQCLEDPEREATILSGDLELWMRRTIAEGDSEVEISEGGIRSGSHLLALKAINKIQEEVFRQKADGMLSRLGREGAARDDFPAKSVLKRASLVSAKTASIPKKASLVSAKTASIPKKASLVSAKTASISKDVGSNNELKSSLLGMVKARMPTQSEAKLCKVRTELYAIMEKYLMEISGEPMLTGTRPKTSTSIEVGPVLDVFNAYRSVVSNLVERSPGIAQKRVENEATRLLHITKCQLGTLAKHEDTVKKSAA